MFDVAPHCKAGEVITSLKTASCEAGPGTTLIYSLEICIWSLLIQEFDDGCCFPNSTCDLPKCHLYKEYMSSLIHTAGEMNNFPCRTDHSCQVPHSQDPLSMLELTVFRLPCSTLIHSSSLIFCFHWNKT